MGQIYDLIFKAIILIVFGEIYQKKVSEGGILKVIAIIQGGIDGAQQGDGRGFGENNVLIKGKFRSRTSRHYGWTGLNG